MNLCDAHNHLQAERFGGRQAEMLAECSEVERMVVNGCCEADWPAVAALAKAHPQVLPSFGYHPWYIHERSDDWEAELNRMLDAHPAAVGEIGLDRWKEGLDYEGQEEVFVTQLRIAAERNLPASIHCLKAWGRMLELLQEGPIPERGFLLHSYGGSAEMIPAFAALGAYFSFPGYFFNLFLKFFFFFAFLVHLTLKFFVYFVFNVSFAGFRFLAGHFFSNTLGDMQSPRNWCFW